MSGSRRGMGFFEGVQMAQQENNNQLAQLGGLLGLQAQMEQAAINREMKPLQLEQLRIAIQNAKANQALRNQALGGVMGGGQAPAFGEGGVSLPGGGQGNLNTGQVVPPQAPRTGGGAGIDPRLTAFLMSGDPGLVALAKAELERSKPSDKVRDALALGYQPGTPEFNSFVGTQFTQQGAWRTGPGGTINVAPGFAEGRGAITRAERGAESEFKIGEFPVTDAQGRTGTQRMTEAEFLATRPRPSGAPVPQPSPAPAPTIDLTGRPPAEAAAIQQVLAASQQGRPASVSVPAPSPAPTPASAGGMGRIPTANVVPGSVPPVGFERRYTPEEVAEQEARKAALRGRAEGGVKFEDGVLDNANRARTSLTQLQILAPNLEKLKTGPVYPTLVSAASYLKQFGIDVGQISKDLGPAQATEAILNQLALKLRNPAGGEGMPGAMSDKDREFLVAAIPNLSKSQDGNRQLLDIMMKLEQRKIDEGAIVSRMQRDGKSTNEIREALAQFANSRELFNRRR